MLRITQLSRKGQPLTIKLEGELLEPWVSLVRDACSRRRRSRQLCLDLSAVTYADSAGAQLLGSLVHEGVEITPCSNFVAELLWPEKPQSP